MNKTIQHKSKLGYGLYTIPDISRILGFPQSTVSRYIKLYWDKKVGKEVYGDSYSWSVDNRTKAVNFYVLIELYTFIHLQKLGVSVQKISKSRIHLAKELGTPYPFAFAGILSNGSKIWYEFQDSIIDADGSRQTNLVQIIHEFAKRIDFNSDNKLASRFYPSGKDKCIVVDPHHKFGMPIVKGTNINTEILHSMLSSGESIESLSILYDLSKGQIKDVMSFYKEEAA